MNEAITVARKEMRELVGRWQSPTATVLQSAAVVFLGGVLFPAFSPAPWTDLGAAVTFYFVLPSAMAGMAAADAFAGERERRTLETLLATPLSDTAIVVGKITSAVLFALSIAGATLGCAIVVTNFAFPALRPLVPGLWFAVGLLSGTAAASFLVASCAVAISMRVFVARSAQQLTNLVTMVLAFTVFAAARQWSAAGSPMALAAMDTTLAAAGAVATALAVGTFGRHRIFEGPVRSPTDITADLRDAFGMFTGPRRAITNIVVHGRSVAAMIASTAVSLAYAALWISHVDLSARARAAVFARAIELPPETLERAVDAGAKLMGVSVIAYALLGPALMAIVAAAILWALLSRLATAPTYSRLLAVAAYGLLPLTVARAIAALLILWQGSVPQPALSSLLPSSLGVFLPIGTSPVLMRLAGSVDLFSLWAIALVAEGTRVAAAVSRARATAIVVLAWLLVTVVLAFAPAVLPRIAG